MLIIFVTCPTLPFACKLMPSHCLCGVGKILLYVPLILDFFFRFPLLEVRRCCENATGPTLDNGLRSLYVKSVQIYSVCLQSVLFLTVRNPEQDQARIRWEVMS